MVAHANGWSISPYPNGHAFGFSIVHDADSAYSKRLAPLFDVFDEIGFKITATAFAFWASWAEEGKILSRWLGSSDAERRWSAPKAVPLEVPDERNYYLDLASRGHEIGLHSPSETSSRREEVQRALQSFEHAFGHRLSIYVEHAWQENKDAQANEGAQRDSPYYNSDVLNASGAWVWVDHNSSLTHRRPRFYDVLERDGTPFDAEARARFGINKGFVRSGQPQEATGDGFLRWYSPANLTDLAKRGGLALVYTHLDAGWIDGATRQMRGDIRERLAFIKSLDPWLAPAGVILDRFERLPSLAVRVEGTNLGVHNRGSQSLAAVTVIAPGNDVRLRRGGRILPTRPDAKIILGDVAGSSEIWLDIA